MTLKVSSNIGKRGNSRYHAELLSGIFIVCISIFLSCFANAQTTGFGTISGRVTDSSGAVIPGAQLTISSAATGVIHSSSTNNSGYFEVNALNPDQYRITVSAPGFEKLVREGITLVADGHVNVPMTLSLGRSIQTVVVDADATLLNTESGSNGQVLTTQQMESVPVSGANPMQLAEMAPGVQSPNSQTYSMDGTLGWNGVSNFGSNGILGANEYSLDGAPNEGNQRANAISPSVDEIAEMKMDVTGFDTTVGHTYGVSVTQTTKSGTNDIHGTIRELYQDRRWAAMQHFQGLNYRYQQSLDHCAGPETSEQCFIDENTFGQPGLHENNSAASVGGPVFIPKLYDGRNKFFFFVSVLNDIFADSSANTLSLPTLQERSGNFNDLPVQTTNVPAAFTSVCPTGTPYYGQYQIYNPFSVTLNANGVPSRTPFCGNLVPASLLTTNSKMVSFYNSLLPAPTQNSPTGSNYSYTNPQPQTFRQFTQRMDYALSQSDHIFFRWTRAHYTKAGTGFTVGDVDIQQGPRWIETGALGWNHIFNSKTNLDITVGATNYETWCCYYPGYEAYSPSSVGLPSYLDDYAGTSQTLPILNVSGYQQVGQVNNVPDYYRTLALRGNLTRVQGNHTIRIGAEWRQQHFSQGVEGNTSGTYSFDNTYTQQNNGTNNTYSQSNTGLAYAAFLMGVPTTASVSTQASASIGTPYYAFYVGDTWRVTPKLTIIPGIRYEFEYGPTEKRNQQIVGWDPNATLPIASAANIAYQASRSSATPTQQAVLPSSLAVQGGPIYAGVDGASNRQWGNNYRFLPRLAVTYQLTHNDVLRGGYGLFFDTLNALENGGSPTSGIPGSQSSLHAGDFTPNQDGFSATTSVPSSTTFGTNFVAGVSPLADPFPASNGARFNTPIGSSAGAMYYAGGNPAIYDHGLVPARAQRGYVGIQHQFGGSTMVEVAWVGSITTKVPLEQNFAPTPSSFYTGGMQPNTATNTLLASQITNPFALANFNSLAGSNPTQYNLLAHSGYFTQPLISISNLVRAYPQMGGLSMYRSVAESKFQEIQVNLTKRYSHGLTVMAALQINDQHDRDYYANAFDPSPSWEASNNSAPYRFTAEAVYQLPFGRNQMWANSGWKSAVFGGFKVDGSYEVNPGNLLLFGNLFYLGNTSNIKLKNPVYHNDQASGGYNYIQWINVGNVTATNVNGVCTYSGTGFVTNPQCQPNGYNLRVFPTHIGGLRQQGPNTVQTNVERNFRLGDRFNLETRFEVFNLLNRQVSFWPDTNPTDGQFGQVTSDGAANGSGNARWLDIQGRLRF
jgi:Carboxypeptidase regulatory-like domain